MAEKVFSCSSSFFDAQWAVLKLCGLKQKTIPLSLMILWADWVQLSCSYSRWYWLSPQSPGLVTELEHLGCLIMCLEPWWDWLGCEDGWSACSLFLYVIPRYFPLHLAFPWDPSSRSAGPLMWQLKSPQKHRRRTCAMLSWDLDLKLVWLPSPHPVG